MDNQRRTLELLSKCKPELQSRFGLTQLALFGSTARNTAGKDSDVCEGHDIMFNCEKCKEPYLHYRPSLNLRRTS